MSTLSPLQLGQLVKDEALRLGFHLCGVSGPLERRNAEFYEWWVEQGFGAGMHFLRRQKARRRAITEVLPGARSVVVCALRFPGAPEETAPADAGERAYGKVARYALHEDYHARLLPRLAELARRLDTAAGTAGSLAYVDTGAFSERAYARQAGLGWVGKNSLLLHPEEGSWFWLGAVITCAELAPDQPMADHCGKCRRCVDACPTGAILEELRAVDSRKCLSYWNIEHRGPIPPELHKPMGDWLLGCDICQEVCPWNTHSLRKARAQEGPPPVEYIPLDEILALAPGEFQAKYKSRALSRAKLEGLQRNAEIIKANKKS